MEIVFGYVKGLLTEAGFSEITHIEDIRKTEYDQYVASNNKEALPKFIVSAKK